MKAFLVFLMGLVGILAKGPFNLFSATVEKYGFAEEGLESGSHIIQVEDNIFHIYAPNNASAPVKVIKYDNSTWKLPASNDGNQWLAWYFKSSLGNLDGFHSMSSKWTVPPLPKAKSNLAIFNSLQASYDPKSYNYIIQPVLATGTWMLGSYPGSWALSAVMCPAQGSCLFSKPIATKPGNVILGVMKMLSGSTNSYKFQIDITDLTAKTPTQSIQYSTKYFAPMALVSLEHNPAGSLKTCDELPEGAATLDFVENVLQPATMDYWQGSQSEFSCGLGVDMFLFDDSRLSIKL